MATIFLTSGDDKRTIINGGSYTIDALGGFDTLSFGTSLRSAYVITTAADGAIEVDTVSGASSRFHATLYNTERLLFDNERDSLDVARLFDDTGSTLTGTEGNDTLAALASTTTIDGGGGIDTVQFGQPRSAVNLRATTVGFTLDVSGSTGSLELRNVERLRFSDQSLALDLSGHAGIVAKTLGAVFGPESVANTVYAGIGLQLSDGGMDAATLMQLALDFQLGANAPAGAVVTLLYTNVVGTAPDDETLAGFVALLDDQVHTPATLGLLAADTELNLARIDFTGLASFGLVYDAMPAG